MPEWIVDPADAGVRLDKYLAAEGRAGSRPRAAAALERDALMPSADATLKFLNQFRSYAATYTLGRDRLRRHLDAIAPPGGDKNVRWRAFVDALSNPAQILPPEPRRGK